MCISRPVLLCSVTLLLLAPCDRLAFAQENDNIPHVPAVPWSKWPEWLFAPADGHQDGNSTHPAESRDPTQAMGELQRLLNTHVEPEATAAAVSAPRIPSLLVRGKVIGSDGAPVVLLMVGEGQTIRVRPGREYLLTGDYSQPITLELLAVTPSGVEVEIQPLGKRLTLP